MWMMNSVSIQDSFAEQVRRTPDAPAVSDGRIHLTYRELDALANRAAFRLRELGVDGEVAVGILMQRSIDLVVAILAVLKAGGYYLPLHEAFPSERMSWILAEAGDPVLLTDEATREYGLPETAGTVLTIQEALSGSESLESWSGRPDLLAYLMYTSGSTGEPKGIGVPHRAVLKLVDDPCWTGGAHERVLMVAPYAFSVSTYELWVPLLRGGCVVVAPPGPIGIADLRRLIADGQITAVHLTAGLFRVVAEEAPDCLHGIREVLTGGDVISPVAVRRVLDACPDITVRTLYGATETSLFTLTETLRAPYRGDSVVPVGRPMAGVRAYVVDPDLRPVEDGTVGELCIGGGRLARGYLNRPELTAQSFLPDPFANDGSRMFRSGDLVRRADGLIEFVSRATDLVKIRGFRVELGAIETVLALHPAVRQAAVAVKESSVGEPQLVAYVVARTAELGWRELASHVAEVLPDYMVPSVFVALDSLPLTPNGKLERRDLPAPTAQDEMADRSPRDLRETALSELFAGVLGASPGIDQSFFDLHGDSLMATRLLSRIQNRFGLELSMADLFNNPTVTELSQHIAALEGKAA
jgi:amino acid adenylation domain-containing protein